MSGPREGGRGPLQVEQVDLDDGRAIDRRLAADGRPYRAAWILVRAHGLPVGTVTLPFVDGAIDLGRIQAALDEDARALVREQRARLGTATAGSPASGAPPPRHPVRPVSIVVPVVDRPDALDACLTDLLAQRYPSGSFEVVVVDNAPGSSGARDVVQRLAASSDRVTYVSEPRRGSSRARDRGAAEARHDVIAFVDADVRVDPGLLGALSRHFEDPSVGCVTGMILPSAFDTTAQRQMESWAGYNKGFRTRRFTRRRDAGTGSLHPYAAAAFGSGANMAFRRVTLDAIGGFDRTLGAATPARGGEDLAAFLDTILAGWTLVYEPQAIVWHRHPEDLAELERKIFGYGVGLTAYLVRTAARDPRHAVAIAARAPAGLAHLATTRGGERGEAAEPLPRRLLLRELAGMAVGPLAWMASVRRRPRRRARRPTTA